MMGENRKSGGMPYVPQLDGIRAVALFIVIASHLGLKNYVPGGIGLNLFFFLSGFLIASLLRAEADAFGNVNISAFYMRRWVRTYPALIVVMLVSAGYAHWSVTSPHVDKLGVVGQIAMFSNYSEVFQHAHGLPWLPVWSLALEEHFYVLVPLIFCGMRRWLSWSQIAAVCLGFCLVSLIIRVLALPYTSEINMIRFSHLRMDSILFGCCLALWNNPVLDVAAWRPRRWHMVTALAILVFTVVYRDEAFRQTLRHTLQGIAIFVLFTAALSNEGRVKGVLASKACRVVSELSYSVYLSHLLVGEIFNALAPGMGGVMRGPIVLGLTFAYAAIVVALVERPTGRLRRRLRQRKRSNQRSIEASPAARAA